MKSIPKCHPSLGTRARYRGALLGLLTVALVGTTLRADQDISSSHSGAFVIYSTPLSKGVLPETLLDGKTHQKPFAPKSSPQMLVIDLGNSYRLTNIRNLPPNTQAYILSKKPKDKETWQSLLDAGSPKATNGAVGEYMVFVFEKEPLSFSDPLVDGDPLLPNKASILGAGFGLGNSTPLGVTPLTSTEIISH